MLFQQQQEIAIDIEEQLSTDDKIKQIFQEICGLIEGKVANADLATVVTDESSYQDKLDFHHQEVNVAESKLYWLLPYFILCLLCYFASDLTDHKVFILALFIVTLIVGSLLENTTGIPLGNTIAVSMMSESDQKRKNDLMLRSYKAITQSEQMQDSYLTLFGLASFCYPCGFYGGKINRLSGYSLSEVLNRAISGVRNQVFDCIAISGMGILKLIQNEILVQIERCYRRGDVDNPHSFLKLTPIIDGVHQPDDCIWFDPWYGILRKESEIRQQSDFFQQYPLLNDDDMQTEIISDGKELEQVYEKYSLLIKVFDKFVAKYSHEDHIVESETHLIPEKN